jgi:hypothetical protein
MEQTPAVGEVLPTRIAPAETAWNAPRGVPWLANAVAGGAGALIAIGVIAVGIGLYPDQVKSSGWGGFGLCLGMIAAGYLAIVFLPRLYESTGVTMVVIGIIGATAFVFIPRTRHFSDLRLFFAVTIAAWLIAFVIGPAKARPVLLAVALLLGLGWAQLEVAHVHVTSPFSESGFSTSSASSSSSDFGSSPFDSGTLTPTDTLPEALQTGSGGAGPSFVPQVPVHVSYGQLALVALGFAFVCLFGVAYLDYRGWRGVATAGVLPGVVALILAIEYIANLSKSTVVTGLVAVAAGLFCGTIGASGRRRFTVWIGAFIATVGAIILTARITQASTSGSGRSTAWAFGLFTILFGVAMVLVAMLLARALREPQTEA